MNINCSTLLRCLALMIGLISGTEALSQKKVAIDELKNDSYEKFENGELITAEDLKEGFEFHNNIVNGADIVVNFLNQNGDPQPVTRLRTATNNVVYEIKGFAVKDEHVTLQLTKPRQNPVTVKIKISPKPPSINIAGFKCDQSEKDKLIYSKSSSCQPEVDGKPFGEDSSNYDANTVVYVYDYKPGIDGRMYKVELNKNGRLQKKPVNFSTEKLSPKSSAWLKIVNANKYLYDISVDHARIDYGSEANALFTNFFTGDSNLMGTLISLANQSLTTAQKSGQDEAIVGLLARITCFLQTYNALQAKMLSAFSGCENFPCCQDEMLVNYYDLANRLLEIRIVGAQVQTQINEKKAELKKHTDEKAACKKTDTDIQDLKKEKKKIDDKPEAQRTAEEKKKLAELIEAIAALEKKVCKPEDVADLEKKIAAAQKEVDEVKSLDDLLARLPSEAELRRMVVFISNMTTKGSTELHKLNSAGNLVDFAIEIKTKDSIAKVLGMTQHSKFHEQIPVLGRPFVSFSSGVFIAATSYLKNKTYDWQKRADATNAVQDTSKYLLVESGYSVPAMGFAALGNLEWKFSRNFGLGFSVGVGITIESSPRPAYLLGGSAFFGDLRQFAVTAGIAGMQINRLKNNLQAVADGRIAYTTTTPIEYYKEFRTGGF